MPKYKIPVTWTVCGLLEVEAEDLDAAIERVRDNPDDFELPGHHDYVDGSFEVTSDDRQIVEAYNT